MRRLLVLVPLLALACVCAATARADGDPASDYLLVQQVFVPYDLKVPKQKQNELAGVVAAANRSGYKIRVAVIGSAYDLGAVTALWRKPRPYARFLGDEIQFVYKHRLLIVMPNGFGYAWIGHPTSREYGTLAGVPIGPGPAGLVDAAGTAVRKLAAASGVTLAASAPAPASHRNSRDRIVIVVAAVAALAVLVLLRRALRRRRPRQSA